MKKIICLLLCGSLVFGLFAQSEADFGVTDEIPLFNTGFGISPPFFNQPSGENRPTQTSMFGQPLVQFSLDTEVRTWNHADFGITGYASSSSNNSTSSDFFWTIGGVTLGAGLVVGIVSIFHPELDTSMKLLGVSLITGGVGLIFLLIATLTD